MPLHSSVHRIGARMRTKEEDPVIDSKEKGEVICVFGPGIVFQRKGMFRQEESV